MSLDADLLVDRRRMRRKLTFWRVVAVVVLVLAIGAVAAAFGSRSGVIGGPYIARIKITGLIRDDDERVRQLDRLADSSLARAVIVHVDSPGGTTAGSEQLFDALGRVRAKKPVVTVVDSLHHGAGGRLYRRQTDLAGRLGRRAVRVSELRRAAGQDWREGRVDQIVAAQGGAERF
jgi:protease-4